MTAVNFIRVFFQVHGEMFMFWKVFNPFLSGVAIISILFTLIGVVLYVGAHQLQFKKSDWSIIYLTAFCFHLLFAAYSVGNIEFMIVLPFILVLSHKTGRIMNYSLLVSLGMFLWNFGQFALPRTGVSPHRLHQKLGLISTMAKPHTDSLVVAIEDKDLHQNFFEYQLLTRKTNHKIKCTELDSWRISNITILHQKSNYTRKSLTSKSVNDHLPTNKRIYIDSSIMGNITIITN
jgi:signal transduction histidine kinase